MKKRYVRADLIELFTGETFINCTACITDQFLIIEDPDGHTWHNLKNVKALHNVKVQPQPQERKQERNIYFF